MRRSASSESMPPREPNALEAENQKLRRALTRAQATQGELRSLLERLTASPWHPALFQRSLDESLGPRALVAACGIVVMVTPLSASLGVPLIGGATLICAAILWLQRRAQMAPA